MLDLEYETRLKSTMHKLARLGAGAGAVIGSLVAAGWLFNSEEFQSLLPGIAAMKFNTAVGFVLLGIGLMNRSRKPIITSVVAILVLVIGLLTFSEYLFGLNLGIDQLIVRTGSAFDPSLYPGRMSPITAFSFCLIGSSLLLFLHSRRFAVAQSLILLAGFTSLLAFAGYLYDVSSFYQISTLTSIALITAVTFIVISLAILFTFPDRGFMPGLLTNRAGGILARRLLPAALVLPLVLGWLRLKGQQAGYYDTEFGLALFALANVVVFVGLIFWAARLLNRMDDERTQAMKALQHAHRELELRVQERTGELAQANQTLEREVSERKHSQTLYQSLIEHLPNTAVIMFDSEMRYEVAEGPILKTTGYSQEQMLGKTIFEVLAPESQRALLPLYQRVLQGESFQLERSAQGMHYDSHFVPVYDDAGTVDHGLIVVQDITPRVQAEQALRSKLEEERVFQVSLKALHEITIELTKVDGLDDFYRRAVELGLERLGFERLGLLLYDPENSVAVGTYGTDAQGRLVAEHDLRLDPGILTGILYRALQQSERFALDEDAELFSNFERIGTGWNAAAVLWNGTESLGWLAVDNGVRHTPLTKSALDILALYALSLGTLLAQKQTQAVLQQSEERFRRAITSAPFPIMIHAEDGEILHLSKMWTELTGYTPGEIPTIEAWTERAYGQRKSVVKDLIDTVYSREKPLKGGEFKVRTKAGDIRTWDFIAAPLGLLPDGRRMVSSMAMDITERKQAEQALKRSEHLLRTVLENLPVGVMITDPEGQVTFGNQALQQIWAGLKYVGIDSYGEYKGWRVDSGEPITADEWAAARAVQKGETTLNEEVEIECFDGTHKFILNSAIPIRDSEQANQGTFIVNQDVTGIKQAGIALQKANQQLEQANQEIQRFASIVSHDLRAPLINLKGFSAMLQTSVQQLDNVANEFQSGLPEKEQRLVQTVLKDKIPTALRFITTSVDRMDHLTASILKLSRLGRLELNYQNVDMNDLVAHILQSLGAQIQEQRIEMTVEELPIILGDRLALDQIFSNVITNAVKYLEPTRPGEIHISAEQTNHETIFHVTDNGRGIAVSDYDKVFAPFRRAGRPNVEGEGMGLAYVQALVKRLQGRIWFTSELDVGTTFSFSIPQR